MFSLGKNLGEHKFIILYQFLTTKINIFALTSIFDNGWQFFSAFFLRRSDLFKANFRLISFTSSWSFSITSVVELEGAELINNLIRVQVAYLIFTKFSHLLRNMHLFGTKRLLILEKDVNWFFKVFSLIFNFSILGFAEYLI